MTGLEPVRRGIGIRNDYCMFGERTIEWLDPALPALELLFHEVSYRIGYVDKWHLDADEPIDDLSDRGFDYCFHRSPHVGRRLRVLSWGP